MVHVPSLLFLGGSMAYFSGVLLFQLVSEADQEKSANG